MLESVVNGVESVSVASDTSKGHTLRKCADSKAYIQETRRRSNSLDQLIHASQAHFTGFLSPPSLALAYLDWAMHFANAPGLQIALSQAGGAQWRRLLSPAEWRKPDWRDRRFQDEGWSHAPFNYFSQAFLLYEEWIDSISNEVPGVAAHHARIVSFARKQLLDVFSPSNIPWMNPEVCRATAKQRGWNFINGARHFLEDSWHYINNRREPGASDFVVGKDLAVTPGKVVFRNELIELIQYAPTTSQVKSEPILIVPAWIMKYYILDLQPHNSLIGYLVAHGFTVFCISWRNPGEELRDVGLDDYRRLGIMAALNVIEAICAGERVHACGYCLGGTLLAIAAAAMARDCDRRLASVSLLAAQTDFKEAGELQLFIDESELALLDDVMRSQGYLDSTQMAGAFQMLRSNNLIWSRLVKDYLLGEREKSNDLMAWNDDATRMPYKMHSEYLRQLFLDNDLAEGRFVVEGSPITISEIDLPFFCVSTETDHVAPWTSVYKIHLLNSGDITFVLTSGGHNAGIICEPARPNIHYRIAHRPPAWPYLAPLDWQRQASTVDGSWWPEWVSWLNAHCYKQTAPPHLGADGQFAAVGDAPGTYVFER
jgi:polyhydroxyalkanoate synthase